MLYDFVWVATSIVDAICKLSLVFIAIRWLRWRIEK